MIGERLRTLRKWRQLTQVQLAQASGLAQNYISALERGTAKNPSHNVINRLAQALEVSRAELTTPLISQSETVDVAVPLESGELAHRSSYQPENASGHLYKGYRVMASSTEGGVYCAYVAVEVDGNPLPQHYFGSRGVEWGFLGAGPQALAYDLLVYEYGVTVARNHLQAFTEAVIAHLPTYVSQEPGSHLEWALTSTEIREWLLRQGRPEPIHIYVPPDMWDAGAGGEPRTTVYGRFLPDRRLVLELALVYSNTSAYRKVLFAKEQELRPDPEPWLVWHDVRDVAPEEYLLFRA